MSESPRSGAARANHRHTPHQLALRCCLHNVQRLAGVLLTQALVRLLALSPALYYLAGGRLGFIPAAYAPYGLGLLTAALYLLLVFPLRWRAAFALKRLIFSARRRDHFPRGKYAALLSASVVRIFCGLLWGVPFLSLAARFYQYIFVFDGTRFNRDFAAIGGALRPALDTGARAELGAAVFFGALLLSLLLFLYGWRRGAAFDYQPVYRVGVWESWQRAKAARRRGRGMLLCTSLVNFLLCLPPLLSAVLIPYLKLRPLLTGKAMNDAQLIYAYFQAGMLSGGTLPLAAALALLLYVPLIAYRKARCAAAVVLANEKEHR